MPRTLSVRNLYRACRIEPVNITQSWNLQTFMAASSRSFTDVSYRRRSGGNHRQSSLPARHGVTSYCLYEDPNEVLQTYQIDPLRAKGSSSPLIGIARNQVASVGRSIDLADFFDRSKLRFRLGLGGSFVISKSDGQLVAVGAVAMTVERWRMIRLFAAQLCEAATISR